MGRYQRNCGHMTLRTMSKPAELAELDPAFLKLNLSRTRSCPEKRSRKSCKNCLTEFIGMLGGNIGLDDCTILRQCLYTVICITGTCYIDVSLHRVSGFRGYYALNHRV